MGKDLFKWRASARYERGASSPLCVPLRALEWGYDCFALRAMSLRDGIPSCAPCSPCDVTSRQNSVMRSLLVVRCRFMTEFRYQTITILLAMQAFVKICMANTE